VLMLLVAVMARVIGNVSVISVALIFSCSWVPVILKLVSLIL
jgi:hypothetical protein